MMFAWESLIHEEFKTTGESDSSDGISVIR